MDDRWIAMVVIVVVLAVAGVLFGMIYTGQQSNKRENVIISQCIDHGGTVIRTPQGPVCVQ